MTHSTTLGIEINPKYVGALFTERMDKTLRVFCYFTNGDTSQFDVPAAENLDNLHHFFSKLNMDATCSSVIINEVVLGRVYSRSAEQHSLYTLLSTPGTVLPPFNADICDLPWRLCWQSQEADILEYGRSGEPIHCFAIRTQVTEGDALRLIKDARAFLNPVSCQKKQPYRWLYLNLALVLVGLATLIGLTVFYSSKETAGKPVAPVIAKETPALPPGASYYLLSNHQISGPYTVKTLALMNTGGLINAATLCRPENSTEWLPLTRVLPNTP